MMKLLRNKERLNLQKCLAYFAQAGIALSGLLYSNNALSLETTTGEMNSATAPAVSSALTRPSIFDSSPYVEAGYTEDRLTNSAPSWKSQYINLFMPLKAYGLLNVRIENVDRFLLTDQAISFSYAYPFALGVINLDGGYTANAEFLAKNSVGLCWNGKLPDGFGYTLGAAQRNYSDALLNIYSLGVEKNAGQFRIAYTASISTIDNSQGEFAGRVQAQWISRKDNRLGLTYAEGKEPSVVSAGNLTTIQTQYLQLDGLYRVTKTTAVTAAFWHSKEGNYYQRNGGQLGLRISL